MEDNNPNEHKRAIWAIQRRYNISNTTSKNNTRQRNSRHQSPPDSQHRARKVSPGRPKRSSFKRIAIFITLLIIICFGIFGYKIIAASDKITVTDRSILGQIKDLFLSQGNMLAGESEGRINILLIAIGGEGHKGQNLADTIMLASLDPYTNKAALLSIPRDLYVQVPEREYYSKINAVHAYGESQKQDQGPVVLDALLEEITGQPIHYYVRVDFIAFKNIVDAIGGINITIDNSFFDYWHKISFPAGTEKMNGERALAYVRARYIEGPEGGDFKRAARQQQVLLAAREKVFSVQTALDFTKLNGILNSLSDNIRTNLQLWEMKRLYELARIIEPTAVHSEVLTSGTKGVLTGGTEILSGVPASVLRPRTDDYSEIHTIAANMLTQTEPVQQTITPTQTPDTPDPTPSPSPSPEEEIVLPTLEIRNGTTINGLAKRTSDELATQDYSTVTIGNAADQNTAQTTIYYLSSEQQNNAQALASILNATATEQPPAAEPTTAADILIILGQDRQ